jgi:hypothetical protein
MTILRATMTALVLVCFMGATLPAAGQDARPAGKAAHQSHAKKRTQVARHAKPAAVRGPSASEQWMNRGSESSSGGGGGGGGGY